MTPVSSQAIVFLTHRHEDAILRHFARLREETKDLLQTFLCLNEQPGTRTPKNLSADFTIRIEEAARMLPARCAGFLDQNGRLDSGFTDLLAVPALLNPRLAPFEFLWLVEYDVDYAGHWGQFFSRTMVSPADLLGTTIFPRGQSENWFHWRLFRTPPDATPDLQLRSFVPIVRFSRRLLQLYVETVRDPRWQGHFEALYPTVARHHGCLIHDLGGSGPYCPPAWISTNYSNSPLRTYLSPGTFVYRPAKSDKYFHEAPERFDKPDYLYHPVKAPIAPSLADTVHGAAGE